MRVSFEVGLERRRHVKLSVIPQLDHEIVFFLPICSLVLCPTSRAHADLDTRCLASLAEYSLEDLAGEARANFHFEYCVLCTLLLRLTGTYLTSHTVENLD